MRGFGPTTDHSPQSSLYSGLNMLTPSEMRDDSWESSGWADMEVTCREGARFSWTLDLKATFKKHRIPQRQIEQVHPPLGRFF